MAAANTADPAAPSASDSSVSAESNGDWPFEASDVPVDPAFVFGRLGNGLRYILRENATPEGTALVRMRIGSGSLAETDAERGLAHFLEHMAFNGSRGVPEGEMVKLLEREGLAFGADTNASTGYEAVTYRLDLPRNEADLLGTALLLMRETASELTIAPDAVERERGVVLAELRDRRNYAMRAREDGMRFAAPGARFVERLPIGTRTTIERATADDLRALYRRTYTPVNTVLVVIGDFPIEVMEAAIREHFADWSGDPAPADPRTGPFDTARAGLTDIHLHPALSESVAITRYATWRDGPDSAANRRASALRGVAYAIVNRRLARLARTEDAPFKRARYSSSDLFEDARGTTLSIATVDGGWREGMLAAVREVNQARTFGFTRGEIAEQLANRRTALENAARGEATRSNAALAGAALALISDERIPTTARYRLDRFEAMQDEFTPEALLAALIDDAAPLGDPLIRFQGRVAPAGGADGLRDAFAQALSLPIFAPPETGQTRFGYTDFGKPGTIVSDTRDDRFGFRYVVFANGVRLTLKRTDIRADRIAFRVSVDGGSLLNTRADPLATYLVGSLPAGGLGRHSEDELRSILAGRSVGLRVANSPDAFSFAGGTTPRDLTLQLQVITAGLTDPGYRREGLARFRQGIDDYFEALDATPASALGANRGRVLTDGDPRFSLQPRADYAALDYFRLDATIGDRLANGATEVALVGDFDEDTAIAAVATTLGALPPREAEFRRREDARIRDFTRQRGEVRIEHRGEDDQALVQLVWPTRDDGDPVETIELALLARTVRLELTERLRERLGQAYSTSASSSTSRVYPGYGTFTVSAPVAVGDVASVRQTIDELFADLRDSPLPDDTLDRARAPLLDAYNNALKSLGGWLSLAARAQSEPERLDRWLNAPDIARSITPQDLQRVARRYVRAGEAVEFVVLPAANTGAQADALQDAAPAL